MEEWINVVDLKLAIGETARIPLMFSIVVPLYSPLKTPFKEFRLWLKCAPPKRPNKRTKELKIQDSITSNSRHELLKG